MSARLLLAASLCWLALAAACADVWLVALLLTLTAGAVLVWCWLAPDADQEAQP